MLRWLRSSGWATMARRHQPCPAPPWRRDSRAGALAAAQRLAVEAALQQAARLAGPRPVGSHHLLLAALADADSAASSALASFGVDLDDLRDKLRSAKVAGTSDEQPEEAGRRQMAIEVSDETLTLVLTDPVIVKAGQEALRFVNAEAGKQRPADEADGGESAAGGESATGDAESTVSASVTSRVIRGDHPAAAGLAQVWVELHSTLSTLAGKRSPAFAPGAPASPGAPARSTNWHRRVTEPADHATRRSPGRGPGSGSLA